MAFTHTLDATARAAAPRPVRAVAHVLVLSALTVAALSTFVLIRLDGWHYYTTPLAVRGYESAHRLLRPAGRVGHLFGVGGLLMMLVPIAYSARKKIRRFRNAGSMKTWLDVHIFAGIVGPVLVTFHTSFKFNGIISVAYWSMVAVVLSGFVGRYLYTRIPRGLRGLELSQAEVDARALELSRALAGAALPDAVLVEIDAFERRVTSGSERPSYLELFVGELRVRRETARFRASISGRDAASDLRHDVIDVAAERALLLRRMACLEKTKRLFNMWHVFHMPLVYIMFAIVGVHVAVTLYMGYVPFMD